MNNDLGGYYQFSSVLCQSSTINPRAIDGEDQWHAMNETTKKNISMGRQASRFEGFCRNETYP